MALGALGKREQAVTAFSRAIALQPQNAAAHNSLGAALNEMITTTASGASKKTAIRITTVPRSARQGVMQMPGIEATTKF